MPDPNPVPGHEDADDVEPVALGIAAVPVDPDLGRSRELAPLPPPDGLDRLAELEALSGLYLDEGDDPMSLRDQVDVPMPGTVAPVHDLPAVALQPPFRDPLAQQPELLPSM